MASLIPEKGNSKVMVAGGRPAGNGLMKNASSSQRGRTTNTTNIKPAQFSGPLPMNLPSIKSSQTVRTIRKVVVGMENIDNSDKKAIEKVNNATSGLKAKSGWNVPKSPDATPPPLPTTTATAEDNSSIPPVPLTNTTSKPIISMDKPNPVVTTCTWLEDDEMDFSKEPNFDKDKNKNNTSSGDTQTTVVSSSNGEKIPDVQRKNTPTVGKKTNSAEGNNLSSTLKASGSGTNSDVSKSKNVDNNIAPERRLSTNKHIEKSKTTENKYTEKSKATENKQIEKNKTTEKDGTLLIAQLKDIKDALLNTQANLQSVTKSFQDLIHSVGKLLNEIKGHHKQQTVDQSPNGDPIVTSDMTIEDVGGLDELNINTSAKEQKSSHEADGVKMIDKEGTQPFNEQHGHPGAVMDEDQHDYYSSSRQYPRRRNNHQYRGNNNNNRGVSFKTRFNPANQQQQQSYPAVLSSPGNWRDD